jgi:protein-tyrosine phosphatase
MISLVRKAGLADQIEVDSAGTMGWNSGSSPDPRSTETAHSRGIDLEGRARAVDSGDLETFNYLLAMDRGHLEDLRALARDPVIRSKIHLLRSFDPLAPPGAEVPDPYAGGPQGFEKVFDMCQTACEGLLAHLRSEL